MDTAADLRVMLESLAKEDGVFGRVETEDAGSVEEHVYGLVLVAQRAWAPYAIEGSRGPTRPADISDALTTIDREEVATVMTYLSAGDLVFPGRLRRDREHAHRAAQRVVKLLTGLHVVDEHRTIGCGPRVDRYLGSPSMEWSQARATGLSWPCSKSEKTDAWRFAVLNTALGVRSPLGTAEEPPVHPGRAGPPRTAGVRGR